MKIVTIVFVKVRPKMMILTKKYFRSCGFLEEKIGIGKRQIIFKYFTRSPPESPLLPKASKEFSQNTRLSADFHADPRMESYRRRTWATYGQGEWKWIF